MASYYLKSGAGAADYNAAHTYALGDKIVPAISDATSNATNARKAVWECTTAGTTNGAITWANPTYDSTTITQNGVVFTARKPGYSSGATANWAFATIYLEYLYAAMTASGDIGYVSNNHAESVSSMSSLTPNNVNQQLLCVSDSAAPPTADATTATVTTTGNTGIGINGSPQIPFYVRGITFIPGSGASGTASITTKASICESCSFQIATTGGSSTIDMRGGKHINCTYKFAAAGQTILASASSLRIIGGSLLSGGTSPTSLFGATAPADGLIDGLDLTNANAAINICADGSVNRSLRLRNVRLPASFSGSVNSSQPAADPNTLFEMMNCDNTGTNYFLSRKQWGGTVVHETTIVRSSGANDGTNGVSWKMVTNSSAGQFPGNCISTPEIVVWVPAGSVTVTVEVVSSASVNNDEFWIEVVSLNTSGAPLGTLTTSAKAGVLASAAAVTTSTATWSSSPSTPVYQKASVSITTQIAGFVNIVGKLCKASKTLYMDPKPTITGITSSVQRQIPGGAFVNEIQSASGGMPMVGSGLAGAGNA